MLMHLKYALMVSDNNDDDDDHEEGDYVDSLTGKTTNEVTQNTYIII